ncbi:hypothetical protein B0J18DRAFT_422217 [Chaetomium sp. MPI-SDFR-AT-0129]|nr:hypothetical protein B0J18DRAFT_422217 [Chaetomium sp. MPI-SDFR-AT-0129]
MSDEEKQTPRIDDGQTISPHNGAAPQDSPVANFTRKQEARVVRKLDWNLMTLFFVLCK